MNDQQELQRDLDKLTEWAHTWGMRFNPSKCNIMRISRSSKPLSKLYTMCDTIISQVEDAKYLGLNINHNLTWTNHINKIVNRANSTLGFLQRNLRSCPEQLKETAYMALVRSCLEYSSTIWDPHLKKDIQHIEKVQRRAARFVKHKYRWDDGSVSAMVKELRWKTLEERRRLLRLVLMFKVVKGLSPVSANDILSPSDTRTRSSHPYKYRHISTRTTQYKHSFFPRTVIDWNSLPADTVEVPTVEAFKERLFSGPPTAKD